MEKAPYSKENYDNAVSQHEEERKELRTKQEEELKGMREDAHGEANDIQDKIKKYEAEIRELMGAKKGSIEKEKTQEKLKYKSVELPKEMMGKPVGEIYEYLKATYGEERFAKMPDDLSKLPDGMKDGNLHYFFGSLHPQDGEATVPAVAWSGGEWYRSTRWLGHVWDSTLRAVILED